MILNHELDVPFPPRFLVQSTCFTDIFLTIEYPLYAHLAPGQKLSPKQEIRKFKASLSRVTIDTTSHFLTVTFKGKKSAARWVDGQVLAMRMLCLVDYERIREDAKLTHASIKLDYYRFTMTVRKGL
ncbi:hypothetical protein PHMEG_0005038 [Phytophthora megakarya]|uniref:Uncharacterized protein n=1 Tax=Phytophthora megakarya TaxID=4795 RepID=A0A225WSC2_9STRA|nr:hypothetical protein PHMEG_0005038 [Phytophthora megakarya]